MLHLGSTTSKGQGGITVAIGEWGNLLQAVHKSYKTADVTLSKIGYQTDNGAFYVFCRGNCSEVCVNQSFSQTIIYSVSHSVSQSSSQSVG